MSQPGPSKPVIRLDDYPYRLTDNVRFGDQDPNQHVNNTSFAVYFETSRVSLIRAPAFGLMPEGLSWVLAHLAIDFKAEVHWPGTVELGLAVSRLGRTSVTYDQVIFHNGACAASAVAITVLVDRHTRKPAPLPADVIAKFQPWLRRGEKS
ncbi:MULTISPECIES: thioesterase family protein [unclassified Bradyrhizobium]|uniref:acyl-CoA thioesterase n=1 Tax=unclassified Bradyrhizobium TaxID=2631580 RepID=UPI0032E399E5